MKQRLDLLLVERGLAPSRSLAQAIVMAGQVKQGTVVLSKPGQLTPVDAELTVATPPRYVSRGGDKLASVAAELRLDFTDAVVLDVGSSTGGFTDFALQHGAAKVYAVDVGTAQLAYKLRQDSRVASMERTDIRTAELPEQPDIAVIDVSFISLIKILPAVARLLKPTAPIVAMAKPQFETDKATADRYRGVIRDESVRQRILQLFHANIKKSFTIVAAADSAVTGAEGNRERFYVLKRNSTTSSGRIT
ncbi:MAG TPA: TlyA family RNA methyltransferase [Candidatus Saccharimonadales bacterium]|nr:TlyA family RNA methyltransferase [Candidatus Saccharimonadales bacterium]